MQKFVSGANWSNLSYSELQNQLTAMRAAESQKMAQKTSKQFEDDSQDDW